MVRHPISSPSSGPQILTDQPAKQLASIAVLSCLVFSSPLFSALSENCPHVRLLGPENLDEVHWSMEDLVVPAKLTQMQVVGDALDLAPPLLCQAVQRVVFINDEDNRGTSGRTKSNDRWDLIYLNAASPMFQEGVLKLSDNAKLEAMQTVLHESTHSATRLLYTRSKAAPPALLEWRPDEEVWRPEALAKAEELVKNLRLEGGVIQEWERLHNVFKQQGLAGDYYGDDWADYRNQDQVANGFMSAYGGEDLMEDMAELAGWALMSRRFNGVVNADPDNQACRDMRSSTSDEIPARFSAVYTKLSFLHDLQMIDYESFEDCVGTVGSKFDRPNLAAQPGFQILNPFTSEISTTLSENLSANIGARAPSQNRIFFSLKAEGPVKTAAEPRLANATLMLEIAPAGSDIEMVSWPRGIYRLYAPTPGGGSSRFIVAFAEVGDPIWATQGLVLVTRGSNQRLQGTIVVQDTLRPMARSPVPIGESALHTNIRFLMVK